jgi:hypothetical protein
MKQHESKVDSFVLTVKEVRKRNAFVTRMQNKVGRGDGAKKKKHANDSLRITGRCVDCR